MGCPDRAGKDHQISSCFIIFGSEGEELYSSIPPGRADSSGMWADDMLVLYSAQIFAGFTQLFGSLKSVPIGRDERSYHQITTHQSIQVDEIRSYFRNYKYSTVE